MPSRPTHPSWATTSLRTAARSALACAAAALPALAQAPTQPPTHWAFTPLAPLPTQHTTSATTLPQGPIDALLDEARTRAGLHPNPPAEPHVLLRRAAYVLTGLPPDPALAQAYLQDPSPANFAAAVETLLASPHYAERQARHWLDLARYSDSNGLDENLAFANAFRYRDWVVTAHHQDLPFDRFGTLQIAGDLMVDEPDVGPMGHVATGFLALGPRMLAEQDKPKLVLDTVDEQLDLVGRTFLGLTLGCARCHDHKFDPVSHRDYHAMAGIFHSTKSFAELGHVAKWLDVELTTKAAQQQREAAVAAAEAAERTLREARDRAERELRQELWRAAGRYLLAGAEQLPLGVYLEAESSQDTSLRADDQTWGAPDCTILHTHRGGPQFAAWPVAVPAAGVYHLWARAAAQESRPMRLLVDGRETHAKTLAETTGGWRPEHQRWCDLGRVTLTAGPHLLRLEAVGPHVPHLDALWLGPEPTADGLAPELVAAAARYLARGRTGPLFAPLVRAVRGEPFAVAGAAAPLAACVLGEPTPRDLAELVGRYQTLFAAAALAVGSEPKKATQPLADPALEAARSGLFGSQGVFDLLPEQWQHCLPETAAAELARLAAAAASARGAVPTAGPRALCVAEGEVKDLPVYARGNHLAPAAEPTPRGVPAVLTALVPGPRMPERQSGRAELARWLFDAGNALSARVFVNRIWQRAFGAGLSRTPSNFGLRGDAVVHRELLDWLAADAIAHGWSQKHVWRRLLASAAWQQSSADAPERRERDPDNRMVWRAERQRLDAESVRDAMLAIAGTLDRTMGGTLLATKDRDYVTNDQSQNQADYDAPRRALYLPVVRNAMYDLFTAFDYCDGSVHQEQRPSSAVATQALLLLNAPFVRKAARAFAEAALAAVPVAEHEPLGARQVRWVWAHAYGRAPSPLEVAAAERWFATAAAAGQTAEALPGLCQMVFASNEFLHVD
ncbi:MAG: DUF1553 domain-containing protein [Planctomycetes bacterium]|nr:DUF1553 domain-containing protein [Planctomycetota bacterium]